MQLNNVSFNKRALLSLIVGVIFGILVRNLAIECAAENSGFMQSVSFTGSVYIALLKMLIIPLVLTAIINAIVNLRNHDISSVSIIAFKIIALLLITTGIAAVIGGLVANAFHLGAGLELPGATILGDHSNSGVVSTILGMLPSNPVEAMSSNNVIALVIFAALIGVAALKLHNENKALAEPFIGFIHSAFLVVKKLANMIIALTPLGVFALMTQMSISQGLDTLYQMLYFIGAMYIAMMIVILMHITLLVLVGVNPIIYFKKVYKALLVAFTTRSSFGTMPVTMDVLTNNMKLNPGVANFAPGIGATMGMNACAGIYPAMLVVMTMTILHQPITWETFLIVGLINMMASLGVSGIPGTAFVAAGVTLSTLGLPYAVVAIVQGVDPIIDMGRTATNINGVMTAATVTDRTTRL
ncbi:cation:dicarboxylase symporter family transporter [Francisellaceae bacterium]|nr:cation:dicarboxylase symporter family transporter [Francisellaceae bacterium]